MSFNNTPLQNQEQKPCMEYPITPSPYDMSHQMHNQQNQIQTPQLSSFYTQQLPMLFDTSSLNYTENMMAMSYWAQQQHQHFMTPTSSAPLPSPTSTDSGISASTSPESSSPDQSSGDSFGKIRKNDDMLDDEKVFCTVQGRLNLVGNLRTYRVTKPEILRRVNPPECMNSSTLAAYLRKAKTKSGGVELRQQLEKEGIRLPTNRRRAAPHTVYSAMTEEEAHQAGLDLDMLLRSFFPVEEISQYIAGRAMSPQEREERKRDLLGVIRFSEEMSHLFDNIQVPIMGKSVQNRFFNDQMQQKMEHLSAVSHGFGLYSTKTFKFVDKVVAARTLQLLEQPQIGVPQAPQVPQAQMPHMAQYMQAMPMKYE
ncbi:unnamed protein product [Auanema sp. JU1783]|nr:unnamed protein product [Auanema sp. JU1783]